MITFLTLNNYENLQDLGAIALNGGSPTSTAAAEWYLRFFSCDESPANGELYVYAHEQWHGDHVAAVSPDGSELRLSNEYCVVLPSVFRVSE